MITFVIYLEDDGLTGFQWSCVDDTDNGFCGAYDYFVDIFLAEEVWFGGFRRSGRVTAGTWFLVSLVLWDWRRIGFGDMVVDTGSAGEVLRATAEVKAGGNLMG